MHYMINVTMLRYVTVVLIALVYVSAAYVLPPYFPKCYRDDPALSECLLNATITLRPYLGKGIKEVGFPPIQPYILPKAILDTGNQALNIKAIMTNLTVQGVHNYVFHSLNFDPKKLLFRGNATLSKLKTNGHYEVNGKILAANFRMLGGVAGETGPVQIAFNSTLKLENIDGREHLIPVDLQLAMKVNVGRFQLVDNNQEFAGIANQLLQNSGQEIVDAAIPTIELAAKTVILQLLETAGKAIPYDELLPLSKA